MFMMTSQIFKLLDSSETQKSIFFLSGLSFTEYSQTTAQQGAANTQQHI